MTEHHAKCTKLSSGFREAELATGVRATELNCTADQCQMYIYLHDSMETSSIVLSREVIFNSELHTKNRLLAAGSAEPAERDHNAHSLAELDRPCLTKEWRQRGVAHQPLLVSENESDRPFVLYQNIPSASWAALP